MHTTPTTTGEIVLANAFSINMLTGDAGVEFRKLDVIQAGQLLRELGYQSAVGHADTAAVFASELGLEVPAVRSTIIAQEGRPMIVGQYKGPRLEEGTTRLPEGATIEWWLVSTSYVSTWAQVRS